MKSPDKWRLTRAQADAVDAVIEHGNMPLAAAALGLKVATVREQIGAAMRKAGAHTVVHLVVPWALYSRQTGNAA